MSSKMNIKSSESNTTATFAAVAAGAAMKKETKKKPKPEKRLKRFRSNATIKIQERIERAASQKMFLVQTSPVTACPSYGGASVTLAVLGSTGNVYDVVLCKVPSCTCPDHAKGNLCKHILFVMLKVVGLEQSSQLVFQAAFLEEELKEIVGLLEQRRSRLGMCVVAKKAVREQYAKLAGGDDGEASTSKVERKSMDTECLICYDPLGSDESALTFCKGTCGTNFHSDCMRRWTSRCSGEPTCPACRQPWLDVKTGGHAADSKNMSGEGYTNLGSLQGQRKNRDTSTYHDNSGW
eukprot:CAMPEP_0185741280 /NCGR_PEP_ID=MMETSP1171-20130828/38874_1 /TAXON_ID=374046 /ORGANISM="Helicotheca tamensis, Strain CCMP826" /LENGTH=293 /DNA_ID=CAMNT_0028413239 /DNA_START=14 /DNA_END=892 /DNA_ORIENTATION=-